MTKRLLDLFCGVGGAAMGYHRAGFEVVGVDHRKMPRYPFEFHKADALEFLMEHAHEFDVIHASPPCQGYTRLNYETKGSHPKMVPATREALALTGKPTIMENVPGAPVRSDIVLCGEMFGLAVQRHRWFEIENWECKPLDHPKHQGSVAGYRHGEWVEGPYVAVYGRGGGKGTVEVWQQAMGIDWTTRRTELANAIPPAYTEYLGRQLMDRWQRKYVIPRLSRPPRNFRPKGLQD